MHEYAWVAVYSLMILIVSILGGHLPFMGRVTHSRLQLYLSASAGVMLGAAFFHVMPEAIELSGTNFGWWMALAVVGLFCIERFIAPHSHEIDGGGQHHGDAHLHEKHADGLGHSCGDAHEHEQGPAPTKDHRAAAPAVAGWMAVLGLTIHTFMNGVGLAGAVQFTADLHANAARNNPMVSGLALPGLAMFLAIVLHKPADALAISTVLARKGIRRRKISLVQLGFALMVPIGAVAFFLLRDRLTKGMENELTGAALSFSAGTFLFIALSDLLPEVQFHKHDRFGLFLALVLGVGLMGGIAYLENFGEQAHSHSGHVEHDHDADHDH